MKKHAFLLLMSLTMLAVPTLAQRLDALGQNTDASMLGFGKRQQTFLTVNGAMSNMMQPSFGFSAGQVKSLGWFVSVMTNGVFSGFSPDGDCDADGFTSSYLMMYSGEVSKTRLSVICGAMMRVTGNLCARVGVGYGNRTLLWETVDGTWMRNTAYSVSGIDLSAGLQFNLGKLVLSAEAVTTQFQTIEGKVGVGFAINTK